MAEAAKTSLSSGLDALADVEAHHPPRDELGENGRHQGPTRCRSCWLIRSPDVPSTVALGQCTPGRSPLRLPRCDGVEALAFHTLLSFQGASRNRPCDSPGGSLRRSRRRSGGNLTLGLPGSSTEQPIPWFLRGYPPFQWFVPVRPVREAPSWWLDRHWQTSGRPLVFPREPAAMPPQVHGADNSGPNPGIGTGTLWRHLATSTSYRSAVLCPWAQDGHRSRRNSVPSGFR
jgi:hypothetical protein